ncbi:GAF and ANTAR domain-containing protein [Arthrobacter wenxiniae]|jgi:GAF domain-containing protein|uniref:GAF and ANTAR domain-containing protein n=1 Tax=Arthrobacter wenxiniae TaxID=2713570 RepID=A0A7Y7LZQ6_9MICC|nr:GAF and ANTAR domain-containing protein [Arthrobacter wenxiniae]NVM94988.1 GAF and ANTAR domain-containing protein [Arthrobacter wenxiniae]
MAILSRARRVSAAFVRIADTLVVDYDVIDQLQTLVDESVALLDATAAGLLLVDPAGELQVMASTSERSQLVEVLQSEAGVGPCVDCFRTGAVVSVRDIAADGSAWPQFQSAALSQGFRSLHAVPMRLRGQTIGALNLFRQELGSLSAEDAAIAQAFADVATISLLQERALRESAVVNEQLQRALNSRIVIEQAKGVIAHTANASIDGSFALLRSYARAHNQSLDETARLVVERKLTISS